MFHQQDAVTKFTRRCLFNSNPPQLFVAVAAPVEELITKQPADAEAPVPEDSAAAESVDPVVEDETSAPTGGCSVLSIYLCIYLDPCFFVRARISGEIGHAMIFTGDDVRVVLSSVHRKGVSCEVP